jgi:hypothetical protein
VATLRFGPAEVPSRKSPVEAVRLLREQKFNACEIDFAGGFLGIKHRVERTADAYHESSHATRATMTTAAMATVDGTTPPSLRSTSAQGWLSRFAPSSIRASRVDDRQWFVTAMSPAMPAA